MHQRGPYICHRSSKFVDIDAFKGEVDGFIAEIKGSDDIIIPGDIEIRNIKRAKEEGINIDDALFAQLTEISKELSLDLDDLLNK